MTAPVLARMLGLVVGWARVSRQHLQPCAGSVVQAMSGTAADPPVPKRVSERRLCGSRRAVSGRVGAGAGRGMVEGASEGSDEEARSGQGGSGC